MSDLQILSFSGFRGSGKDTACDYLMSLDPTIKKFSWADELKKEVHGLFHVPLDKLYAHDTIKTTTLTSLTTMDLISVADVVFNIKNVDVKPSRDSLTVRQVLQIWGTDIRRKKDKDCWINKFTHVEGKVVVSDTRFLNEISFVKKNGGKCAWMMSESKGDLHKSESDISSKCHIKIPAKGMEKEELTLELVHIFAKEVGFIYK